MEERLRLCAWDVARGVLEEVALMSNWGRSLPSGSGRGLALVESFGVPVAQCVEVSQMAAGRSLGKWKKPQSCGHAAAPQMMRFG